MDNLQFHQMVGKLRTTRSEITNFGRKLFTIDIKEGANKHGMIYSYLKPT